MSTFEDRTKAFETKYKLDEEKRFALNARAVRLFGVWAAGQLTLSGDLAEAYVQDVIDADFAEPGTKDFIQKVQNDLASKGLELSEHYLENQFVSCCEEAARQLFPA